MQRRFSLKQSIWKIEICFIVFAAVSSNGISEDASTNALIVDQQAVDRAQGFLENGRQAEAELLLTRAVTGNPYDLNAWKLLGDLYLSQADDYTTRGQLSEAGKALESARRAFGKVQEITIDPESANLSADPGMVAGTQKRLAEVETRFKVEVKTASQQQITESLMWANKAHHWLWKNNRDSVVQGLRALRKVHELGPWLDTDTRGLTADAMRKLKDLVYDKEWESLCASAGFDLSIPTENTATSENAQ